MTRNTADSDVPEYVRHRGVKEWVAHMAQIAKPDRIVWCDGSRDECERQLLEAHLAP